MSDENKSKNDPRTDSWIWGLALIVVGVLFLLQNITGYPMISFANWWAVFILVPGISSLANAYRAYRDEGQWDSNARNAGFWGLIMILVAFTFFLNLSWNLMLPAFFILGGLYMLLGSNR